MHKIGYDENMILHRHTWRILSGAISYLILMLFVSAVIARNAQSQPEDSFQPFVEEDYDPKNFDFSPSGYENCTTNSHKSPKSVEW